MQTENQTPDPITPHGKSAVPETPLTVKQKTEIKIQTRAWYKEQMEILKPQVELMKLRKELAQYTYENYAYSVKLDDLHTEMEKSKDTSTNTTTDQVPHVVTAEDLEQNPEMVKAGLKIGDTILLTPKANEEAGESGDVEIPAATPAAEPIADSNENEVK